MPILNYTTKIEAHKTIGEIQATLAKHGARKIIQDYDEKGRVSSLTFTIDTPFGIRAIRLPANVDKVYSVLMRQKVKCDHQQAERVAWRIVKDWVESQMAILESEMVQMDEVFLPYMLNNNEQTLFEAYRNNQILLDGDPGSPTDEMCI